MIYGRPYLVTRLPKPWSVHGIALHSVTQHSVAYHTMVQCRIAYRSVAWLNKALITAEQGQVRRTCGVLTLQMCEERERAGFSYDG